MAQEIIFGEQDSVPEVVEEKVEAPVGGRKNVIKKTPEQKTVGTAGAVAHYHRMEDENEIWDEPCKFVEHIVGRPKGFDINGEVYTGKVVVPACVACQLAVMENHWDAAEMQIYRGSSFYRNVGNV